MVTLRFHQSGRPQSAWVTPIPTPHQIPVVMVRDHQKPGGGGMKTGGNAGHTHGQKMWTGL